MEKKPTYEELEQQVKKLEREINDRKSSDKELRFLSLAVEQSSEGIAMTDMDGNLQYINDSFAEIHGYPAEELLGKNLSVFHTPEQMPFVEAAILEVKQKGSFKGEIWHVRRNGAVFPTLMENSLIRDDFSKPIGMMGTLRDITDIKRTEEALKESEGKYRRVFEKALDAILVADAETGILLDCNRAASEIFGRTKAELIGKHQRILHPPEEVEGEFSRTFEKHLREQEGQTLEAQIITKSGEIKDVSIKANIFKLKNREILQGIFRDETERKRAEIALRESERRYRAFFEHGLDGVITIDPENARVIDFNDQACKQLGYSREEFAQLRISDIDARQDEEEIEVFRKKLMKNRFNDYETLHRNKKGEIRHVHVSVQIIDIDGREVHQAIMRDITDRKRLEEERLRIQKLESVGTLAGGIAHDFNNILTTILGNISLAKNQVRTGDEIFDLLNEAEMASTRAQTLTKQLLTFAKGGTPVKETASLGDIVKESSLFVMRGSKSGCKFSIAEDLRPVEVDIGQISQVINNIVINANQAMPEGGIIEIKAENLIIDEGNEWQLKPGRYIRVSFKDEGVGIAEKHLSKIFDPYFTTKHERSGLGLATSYSIVKNHAGLITVESELGVSTTFHIYLPASEKAAPEKREDTVIKGRGRILVMDDEASLRKMLGRVLEKLGYEPEFAKEGAEAIDMYKEAKDTEKPYDAVILDLTIPGGMGGKEAIEELLEIDPKIKAIVSSGYSDDQVLANFQEYGFKGMIPKPFETLSLSKVLNKVLNSEKE